MIEQAIADGREVSLQGHGRIRPGEGKLEIHYTAPSLLAPEHIRFKYRLEGFDRKWTFASTRRVAYYTNLPAGEYGFRVIAFDDDTLAESPEADLWFAWEAHFYQTGWFYGLWALCLVTVAWAGFRIHVRQTKTRYAAVLAERSRLAREMHDTVIQGCVGISALLEAASSLQNSSVEILLELVDRARAQIRETLKEAQEAVWDLRHTRLEGDGIVPELSEVARQLVVGRDVNIQTEVVGFPFPLNPRIKSTLLLVAREATRNALAHANPREILIRLSFAKEKLCMEVADDGCGFDHQAELSEKKEQYGVMGMRERIEQLGGQFLLLSSPRKGTQVIATIPLNRSAAS